ncbi:MAG: thermonuclease family protein [Bradymonadia bacterium]
MRLHILTLIALLAGCAEDKLPPSPIGRQIARGEQGLVTSVQDGDTFRVTLEDDISVSVRVLGVDCPESSFNAKCERDGAEGRRPCEEQIPLGQRATVRARALLNGQQITLEPGENGFEWDTFGRLLAYVRLPDDQDFGLVMLSEGLCSDFSWRYPHPRQGPYREADTLGP